MEEIRKPRKDKKSFSNIKDETIIEPKYHRTTENCTKKFSMNRNILLEKETAWNNTLKQ